MTYAEAERAIRYMVRRLNRVKYVSRQWLVRTGLATDEKKGVDFGSHFII